MTTAKTTKVTDKREVDRAIKLGVAKLGVPGLASRLKVSTAAIYYWLGTKTRKSRPSEPIAKRLLALKARLASIRKEA